MTHPVDPFVPTQDDTARTQRQLRLMKALLTLDDPEVERALTVIVEVWSRWPGIVTRTAAIILPRRETRR